MRQEIWKVYMLAAVSTLPLAGSGVVNTKGWGIYAMQLNGREHHAQLNGKGSSLSMDGERKLGISAEVPHDQYTVNVADLLGILWRRLWVILVVAVVFAGFAAGFSFLQTPLYSASVKILVGQEQVTNTPANLGGDVQGLQKITQTVAGLVNTRPVAEDVIQELDLQMTPEELLKNISVKQVGETQTIEVSYNDPSPERAQEIANAIGDVFSGQVSKVSPNANSITATVWEQAALPSSPVSPKPLRNGLLALVLGSMLGVGLAFLLEQLDVRWRSPEEVEQVSGVPTFGVIRTFDVSKTKSKTKDEQKGEN